MMKNNDATKPSKHYYVYTLAYPDGRVFYVGKGTRSRITEHEREANKHYGTGRSLQYICHCKKCLIIRAIWKARGAVTRSIVFETNDEKRAYNYEKSVISQHASPCLCNVMPGSPDINTVALELRNAFDDAELQKQETGRRSMGSGSVYQNRVGRWCAAVRCTDPTNGRSWRKKFEDKDRDSAVAKMLLFIEQRNVKK